jgi:hypothetical protein
VGVDHPAGLSSSLDNLAASSKCSNRPVIRPTVATRQACRSLVEGLLSEDRSEYRVMMSRRLNRLL